MSELNDLVQMLKKDKQTGSDYTGTVTRVEGNTAFVRLTGADIADTPVARTIDCKAGDSVRIRVTNGRAWITGNDTSPPTYDVENINKLNSSYSSVSKKMVALDSQIADIGSVYSLQCTAASNTSRIISVDYSLYVIPIIHLAIVRAYCVSKKNQQNYHVSILSDLPYALDNYHDYEQVLSVQSAHYFNINSGSYVFPGVMEHHGSSIYVSAYTTSDEEVKGTFVYLYSELNENYPLSSGKKVIF